MTQRIENSDRGLTINKGLAWTIGSSLVAAGLYVGITVADLSGKIDSISGDSESAAQSIAGLDNRIRALEIGRGRDDERFNNILEFMARMDSRLERIEKGLTR